MSLQVLGTGMGRTGTHSLKLALERLGFGKCYHMFELFQHPDHLSYFQKAELNEPVNWDALFEGYQSAVDYPVVRYYKQIMEHYPNLKFIHTLRDPDTWYESASETIFRASKPSTQRILKMMIRLPFSSTLRKRLPILQFNGKLIDNEFGKDLKNKQAVVKRYNNFNTEALNLLPKERTLVYDVKSGWEPLCKFLKVPVPSTPFPKSNTKEDFYKTVDDLSKGKPF